MDQRHVTEADLHAYIDGQLDPARRVEVAAYLKAHPEVATVVTEGLRQRDEIRLLLLADEAWPLVPETAALGWFLAWALRLRSLAPRLGRGLAVAGLIGLGWTGHAQLGGRHADVDREADKHPAEALADEAAQAWRVVQLDADAAGDPSRVDPSRPAPPDGPGPAPTPLLPEGLRRVDADLIPWDGGTATLELLVTYEGDELVLLTAETPAAGAEHPEAALVDGVTTVSWWSGRHAYALSGDVPANDLLAIARAIGPMS